jgi:hypothetical protein
MREAGITDAVDLFVYFGAPGGNAKGDVGGIAVAGLMHTLEHNGPNVETYAAAWAIINPAPLGEVRTKIDGYAAVLSVGPIALLVANALSALYYGKPVQAGPAGGPVAA